MMKYRIACIAAQASTNTKTAPTTDIQVKNGNSHTDIPTPAFQYSSSSLSTAVAMSSDPSCYTVIFESSAEYPPASELRSSLEKGSDEVKLDTLRKIIISTINGNPQVS